MMHVAIGLTFLVMVLGWLGGGVIIFALLYGVYVFFFNSMIIGLILIGGAVLAGWVLSLVCGLISWLAGRLMAASVR